MGKTIVGKGEMLFPRCFQKSSFLRLLKEMIFWSRVNPSAHNPTPLKKPFENNVGKGINAGKMHSPLFHNISTISQLNPFPNKSWFLHVCITSLLKTPWEKDKLLVTSNFSFSHSLFYPYGELSAISNLKLSSATSFSLEESKFCCLRKG